MRILFADALDDGGIERLRSAGHECTVDPALSADTLPDHVVGYDVLVVRSTKVTAAAIANADVLGLIVRAGAGTDNIDKEAASARGVYVCNVPGRNAVAVAELTMGLLLAVDRRIADNVADLRAGRWDKSTYTKADGLFGKRMAIIGLGDIGLEVARRAKAFGLQVAAEAKPNRDAAVLSEIRSIGIRLVDSQQALVAEADVISLHVPSTGGTKGLVDRDFLADIKPGAILLNTSRGDIIDQQALLDHLNTSDLRVGLDVYEAEPSSGKADFDSELARHPRVVGTHHIGASTAQAQRSVAEGTIETIEAYIAGNPLNCINLQVDASGKACLSIRHLDRVGVLAQVFAVLRAHGLNVQQMQNQVFQGGGAAVASININEQPGPDVVEALAAIEEVLNVSVVDLEAGSGNDARRRSRR